MFRWTTATRVGWLGPYRQPGPVFAEIADARSSDREPFCAEKPPFELEVAAISAELSRGCDHTMAGHPRLPAFAHDVADSARRPGSSRSFSDVAVGCDPADGNPADDVQHGIGEWRNGHISPVHEFTDSEHDPYPDTTLQSSGLDRQAASFDGFEIDVGSGVTDQPANT
jgi:hypothetical protein